MRFRVCEEGRGRFRFFFQQIVHILFRYKACCVLELMCIQRLTLFGVA